MSEAADEDLRTPLARFGGLRPPAPAWFTKAIANAPERRRIEVEGAAIEVLVWPGPSPGAPRLPGLLFIHGGWAHADWWSFIAPFFTADRPCAALSLSGMGGSDRRARYGYDTYLAEVFATIAAAELGAAPILVAHSFGVSVATHVAARAGERLGGAVIVDGGVRPASRKLTGLGPARPAAIRASFEAQLARFRLMPPQPNENAFLVDHVARSSIRPAIDGEGWVWTFDPWFWERLDQDDRMRPQEAELAAARCPVAIVVGDRSLMVDAEILAYTQAHAPSGTPTVVVPDSGHHVMLDQPLALVAALRVLIAPGLWARTPGAADTDTRT